MRLSSYRKALLLEGLKALLTETQNKCCDDYENSHGAEARQAMEDQAAETKKLINYLITKGYANAS